MTEEDLSSVLEIERISFPNPWHEMTFMGEIYNRPISFPFVIVNRFRDKIAGYIIFWRIEDEVQINTIAVHPDFRRLGIAEAVLKQVLYQLGKEGAKFVTLEVRPSNFAARSLYRKLGFEFLGIRKNYYHSPREHAFVLGKPLD